MEVFRRSYVETTAPFTSEIFSNQVVFQMSNLLKLSIMNY